MKIKWYGTATILLEQGGTQLLFDPFLSLNAKLFKPPMSELSVIDNILVTHGHLDHIADIPDIWKQGGGNTKVYCTATPKETLILKGVEASSIYKIAPGDVLSFGPFEVRVLKGKHVVYNKGLLIKTIVNPRIFSNLSNFRYLRKENKKCAEAGETVIYDVKVSNKRILLMGSLNLDDDTEYPKGADLMILPFQGRTGIEKYAMTFVDRLQPKKVLLDHFDDTFPPVSSPVKTGPFISQMHQKYPDIKITCPKASADWIELG